MTGVPATPVQDRRTAVLAGAPPAVEVHHVSKTFRLPHQQYHTLKERALHPLRSMTYDDLEALQDIDITIRRGEFFGIVGRNGSGKSTLLKCLAGIYRPDEGSVRVHGRLSPFIELGVGFNMDLTARDNVAINAVMMGLSRKEAAAIFDDVIAFAELEEFVDLKLKNYSSGMAVRLAFATAIQVESDVLLIDEVLAVGDAAFQQKCYEEFTRLRKSGRTIVFVTHDMSAVSRFCDRAMLIERGKVVQISGPEEIARAYNEMNFGRLVHAMDDTDDEEGRYGDQAAAEIRDAWFEVDGERVSKIEHGVHTTAAFEVFFHQTVEDPVFGLTLRNEIGHTIFVTTSEWSGGESGSFDVGESVTVRISFDAWLSPSLYKITPSIAHAGSGANAIDLREDLGSVYVHATRATGGIIDFPHELEIRRT